jgi:RNA polymerase sigma-70 factor (ECF subfamily)
MRGGFHRAFLFLSPIAVSNPSDAPHAITPLEDAIHIFRGRLLRLAERHLNPLLLQRMSAEDVLQETLHAAMTRKHFLEEAPEVPLYFKLRQLLFQVLVDAERRHLKAQKRAIHREMPITWGDADDDKSEGAHIAAEALVADISSPFTKTARQDRHALLKRVLNTLPTADRHLLILRHFDNCTNSECAAILEISEKAASLRYVRALARLQERLEQFTEFH